MIDNLRVSKIARAENEFTLHPRNRRADVFTTLWDTFERIEKQEGRPVASHPESMAYGETARVLGGCKMAEGIDGQGLFIP